MYIFAIPHLQKVIRENGYRARFGGFLYVFIECVSQLNCKFKFNTTRLYTTQHELSRLETLSCYKFV